MKRIILNKGMVALVDNLDFNALNKFKWHTVRHRNTFYARRASSRLLGKQKIISMHRSLLNPPKYLIVDHIDGNGLNNQRNNLRICNNSQNHQNSQKHKDNTSGYKGVYHYKNKWVSKIFYDKKLITIGYFKLKNDAALSYNKKAKELFGEFARLNHIK